MNITNPPTLAKCFYAALSDIEHVEMKDFFDKMAAAFVAEEDAWDRTFQYGIDVGLDTGPTS